MFPAFIFQFILYTPASFYIANSDWTTVYLYPGSYLISRLNPAHILKCSSYIDYVFPLYNLNCFNLIGSISAIKLQGLITHSL